MKEYTDEEINQAVAKESRYRDYTVVGMLEALLLTRAKLCEAVSVSDQYRDAAFRNASEVEKLQVKLREADAAPRPVKEGDLIRVDSTRAYFTVATREYAEHINAYPEGFSRVQFHDIIPSSRVPPEARSSVHDVIIEEKPEEEQQIVSFVGARHAQPWPTKSDLPLDGKPRRYTRRMGASGLDERTVEDIVPTPEETIEEAVKRRTRHLERRIQSQRAELRRRQIEADQLKLLRGLVHTTNDVETLRQMALRGLGETNK